MKYENVEKLNRQGTIFVICHTLVIFLMAMDVSMFV